MRFITYTAGDARKPNLALKSEGRLVALPEAQRHRLPIDLFGLIGEGAGALDEAARIIAAHGSPLDEAAITYLSPVPSPRKIMCVGLNYLDHTKESRHEQPGYPTLFLRVPLSIVGHRQALVRPLCSEQFDYEGEMVVFIGKGGRHIARERALEHVIGYAVANEGSVRDYQFKSPQWTVGKNFDSSGAIGPEFVTADEVPAAGKGLKIETRLNGQSVQVANTSQMVFDVETIISVLSEAITLEPGDTILTGTPAGVGMARKPPLFMKHGDRVEVEIEGLGLLQNSVADEVR